ncbi:MAG: hypothetical protein ACI88H_000844 [Cocleimonas sp.]|jgi:hypothetical protein
MALNQLGKLSKCITLGVVTFSLMSLSVSVSAENSFLDNVSGNVAVEGRLFTSDPAFDKQSKSGEVSVSVSPEYKIRSKDDSSQFTFNPFYRWDDADKERTHGDIRQLDYVVAKDDWEFQVGIGKKFWGVTESQHLVDIINQTDGVEGADGEDKLGQPLLRFSKLSDNGSIDFFVLPYFRERTFAGEKGRLRFPLTVDTDNPIYESKSKEEHIDYAFRISESLEEFDVGFSVFDGTSRDPMLTPGLKNGAPVLVPYYPLIRQYGLDLQYTGESIIWKLEAIHREPKSIASGFDTYSAAVGGFEYTLPTITESGAELGLLAEYHRDSRGEAIGVAFQNDLFVGARLALNDEDSSELLAGAFVDLDNSSKSFRVEGSRRIGNGFKINVEAQFFTDIDLNDPLQSFAKDDFIQVELQKFF